VPLRGGPRENSAFRTACSAIRRLADRVYAHDLGKAEGCKRLVDTFETMIDREDYDPSAYNPYQELANRLQQQFPEVWQGDQHNSAQRALARWSVS
jgi:hypothetical protein